MNAELDDDAAQGQRNDDGLENQSDERGDVEVRRVLHISLPGHRRRQHEGVQREDVQQRGESLLVELNKADQHQRAGEHMRDVEGNALH